MGYFDSTKNRALWEIELQNLKKLREERASGKDVRTEKKSAVQKSDRQVVRMTYKELLREEAEANRKTPSKERQAAMEASKERQKEVPKKEARAYEKV